MKLLLVLLLVLSTSADSCGAAVEGWAVVLDSKIPNSTPAGKVVHQATLVIRFASTGAEAPLLCLYDAFEFTVTTEDGVEMIGSPYRNATRSMDKRDRAFIEDGEIWNYTTAITWQEGRLSIADGTYGRWDFSVLKPQTVSINVKYR